MDLTKAPKPVETGIPPGSKRSLAIIHAIRHVEPDLLPTSQLVDKASEVLFVTHRSIFPLFFQDLQELIDLGFVEVYGSDRQKIKDAKLKSLPSLLGGMCRSSVSTPQLQPARPYILDDQVYSFKPASNSADEIYYFGLSQTYHKAAGLLNFSISTLLKQYRNSLLVYPTFQSSFKAKTVDVFVIMPFKQELDDLYRNHIRNACDALGLSVARGDDISGSAHIMNEVWSSLVSCELVIVECSTANANVYYELGIAHTLGKRTILLSQGVGDIPFDVQHWRHLIYDKNSLSAGSFASNLTKVLQFEVDQAIPRQHDLGFLDHQPLPEFESNSRGIINKATSVSVKSVEPGLKTSWKARAWTITKRMSKILFWVAMFGIAIISVLTNVGNNVQSTFENMERQLGKDK